MSKMYFIIPFLLITACSHKKIQGDRRLKDREIPNFLKRYHSSKYHDVDFYEIKNAEEETVYEVKYLEKEKEVSLKFNTKEQLIEEERDIESKDLSISVKNKIEHFFKNFYPGYKIHEVELRTDSQKNNFIDVEIKHNSSPTKYWEMSFDIDGNYKSQKIEHYDEIETLN